MKTMTLPVTGFWVTCRYDQDYDEEFGAHQIDAAKEYLDEKRKEKPELDFELIATVST